MRESSLDAYSADDLIRFRWEYRNLLKRLGERDRETAHLRIDQMLEFGITMIADQFEYPFALAAAIKDIIRGHAFTRHCS